MTDDFAKIDKNEQEYWDDKAAICPYCGFKNRPEESDGCLYSQDTDIYTCEHCSKDFFVDVYWEFSWTTKRLES